MSRRYIELSDGIIEIEASQLDLTNYDNNDGKFKIYALAICEPDDGPVIEERDNYCVECGYDIVNWRNDWATFDIVIEDGSRKETFGAWCDIEIAFCIPMASEEA